MKTATLLIGMFLLVGFNSTAEEVEMRTIIPAIKNGSEVSKEAMDNIYDAVKTPHKYGIVLRGQGDLMVDCPNVFRHDDKWFMMYVCMNEVGYETHLAESDDLLSWQPLGRILSFRQDGWDKWQVDGGVALMDHTWGGSCGLRKFQGKYWLSYIGGARQGYEPPPLSIGIAWTKSLGEPVEWTSIPENPVLSCEQPDVRDFEKLTLFKSNIIWDKSESLGFPFVMFYNAKNKHGHEDIGMAVSKDMIAWSRYGAKEVVANGERQVHGITADPQIVKIDDVWVMFYFGAFWRPKAFDTFACSYDLVHWTKWAGPDLIEPSEPWDSTYAHKPWLIKHNGIVYHYYCAVGDQGRVIALATSKDLKNAKQNGK
ncbi:glycosylase [Candidatus Sumerlaeota bacterium]